MHLKENNSRRTKHRKTTEQNGTEKQRIRQKEEFSKKKKLCDFSVDLGLLCFRPSNLVESGAI